MKFLENVLEKWAKFQNVAFWKKFQPYSREMRNSNRSVLKNSAITKQIRVNIVDVPDAQVNFQPLFPIFTFSCSELVKIWL